jgi:hypothetical protein
MSIFSTKFSCLSELVPGICVLFLYGEVAVQCDHRMESALIKRP